jgi:hypothetical protein
MQEKLRELKSEILSHPPYSPDPSTLGLSSIQIPPEILG